MSDSIQTPLATSASNAQNAPLPTSTAPPPVTSKLNPVTFLTAIGGYGRWPIIRYLADGRAANVSEIAAAIGVVRDIAAKQLRLLRDAGAVESRDGEDRRQTLYQIPAERRKTPGVIDYGFCVLHMDKL